MMFSVIIPTYNRKAGLIECLGALSRQTYQSQWFEVIVVDDGSTQRVEEMIDVSDYPFPLKIITQVNGGAASARNAGADRATGDFLAFTEDDTIPDGDWLERAAAHLTRDTTIDVLEGRTVTESTRTNIRRADAPGIPSFIPCNLFVRTTMFRRTAGYDVSFYDPVHHLYFREDADLGFQLLDKGAKVAIATDVIVSHPVQFAGIEDALRHARRYRFDPLLYRKHPLRFRSMIEVKKLMGMTVRRVQHIMSLLFLFAAAWMVLVALRGFGIELFHLAIVVLLDVLFFKYKYQGIQGFRFSRVWDFPAFALVPLVYLVSVIRGAVRYRSFAVLIP